MTTQSLPLPGIKHGQRIVASVIEHRAESPGDIWASIPIDDNNLSKGFRDLSYKFLNDAANRAAHWIAKNLPITSQEQFQPFAYMGPKDLRYAALAVAAAKLERVLILPSTMASLEAQLHVLGTQNCKIFVQASSLEWDASSRKEAKDITFVRGPSFADLFHENTVLPVIYPRTWEEGRNKPWLVFHTSGTTGLPKPVVYTHSMMAMLDKAASLSDIALNHIHQCASTRWYYPLPFLHFVGMLLLLSSTTYLHSVCVVGPPGPPSPDTIAQIIRYGKVEAALMTPVTLDVLCTTDKGLEVLRGLKYIHYAGAPLSRKTGELLSHYVSLVPAIGSTETGGYFTKIRSTDGATDWDYVEFQEHAGASFRHHLDDMYELVFVRKAECKLQQIFETYPERLEYATSDLWVQHPVRPNLWKIVGRVDDYICFSHGEGMHVTKIEPMIEENASIKSALICGNGHERPLLMVELTDQAMLKDRKVVTKELGHDISRINQSLHEKIQLSSERLILAEKEKPFARTIKGSVARLQTLKLYEKEIQAFQ